MNILEKIKNMIMAEEIEEEEIEEQEESSVLDLRFIEKKLR